tara:strand:- start:1161 stop:1850 length:690 start_codon:yes stop_codon:yes gene_type:complete
MEISVIIPTFNEENTVIELLKRVKKQSDKGTNLEIIVVDDCSTDNSKKLLTENPDLYNKLILLDKNLGKGGAVREGLLNATGEYILFQDADLEYNPKDYKQIFNIIHEYEADVIIGSRFLSPEYTRVHYFYHKVGNRVITFLFNILYNTTFTDIYSCYLSFKRELVQPNNLKSNSWSQQAEILATAVKSSSIYYEVPISYSGRTFEDGKKIKARHTLSVVWMIIKKRLF